MSKYVAKGDAVLRGDEAVCICCYSGEMPDDSQLPGESWLDMRDRTRPAREAYYATASQMAQRIADALNAQEGQE